MKKTPSIHWEGTFPDGVLDTSGLAKAFPSGKSGLKMLLIAIDTEYQGGIDGAGVNRCLCYSFAVSDVESGIYNEGVIYPDWTIKERFSLPFILERIFESIGITGRGVDGYHIILVAHFFAAELSMLKDRSKVVKRLEYMHKSAVSRGALSFHWHNANRNKVSITLDIKDTMLLLPASHLSLQKASAFVDEPKGTLREHEISNMLHLLMTNKAKFEEYAIKDARITLKLFVKLQYYLNHLNGTKSKVYSTLSSASIGKYVSYLYAVLPSKEEDSVSMKSYLFPKKEEHKGELYRKYEDLAKRAYLGGLNAAYNIGAFDDGVYLDMDFSSAYPTVMNMLNAPDFGETPLPPLTDSDVIDMSDLEVPL